MKKVFISQRRNQRTEEEMMYEMNNIIETLEETLDDEFEIIDSHIKEEPSKDKNRSVWLLSKAIEKLAEANIIVFAPLWELERETEIEHEIARLYKIPKIEIVSIGDFS